MSTASAGVMSNLNFQATLNQSLSGKAVCSETQSSSLCGISFRDFCGAFNTPHSASSLNSIKKQIEKSAFGSSMQIKNGVSLKQIQTLDNVIFDLLQKEGITRTALNQAFDEIKS